MTAKRKQEAGKVRKMTAILHGWALIDEKGHIVTWKTLGEDAEEGIEIHRTRQLAKNHAFADEYVVPISIVPRPTKQPSVKKGRKK